MHGHIIMLFPSHTCNQIHLIYLSNLKFPYLITIDWPLINIINHL